MLGAIIGDIVGSRFEGADFKSRDFDLFGNDMHYGSCCFTDDTVITCAVAQALLFYERVKGDEYFKKLVTAAMRRMGRIYSDIGYGGSFQAWLWGEIQGPYNSWGNGSAMRVAPVGWYAETLEEAEHFAALSAEVTHNHPEGIKGAQSVAAAIWMARHGSGLEEIRKFISEKYYPEVLDLPLDLIRPFYGFNESCQGTVPIAFSALFESTDFESAIRNAISMGGDSDTLADITGGMAEALYGIPEEIAKKGKEFLTEDLRIILEEFMRRYGTVQN